MHSPGLVRDLAGNLVGAHRVFGRGLLVPKVGADEHQGHGDAEPQEAQREQGAKWDSTRGFLAPDKDVQAEEDAEADACSGTGEGGRQGGACASDVLLCKRAC